MGYAPALRWLTVVRDREAQFTCVGMGHTASIRYILVLATLPVEAFRTSEFKQKITSENVYEIRM